MTHHEDDCPDTLRSPYSRDVPVLNTEDDRQAFLDALIERHQGPIA
jgi:hypothetical protein